MDPTLSDPLPELIHYLPLWSRSYPIRSLSLYIICRNGPDPIRSDAEACTSSPGMDPILSDLIPELIPLLPEWIRPEPIPYWSLFISFRNGHDPIRPYTGAYTLSSGSDPILSDPMPKLVHLLPGCVRSYPIRYQSLYPFFRNGSDPTRSHTEAYTSSSEEGPTLSDPIRSYPVRCRSSYILSRNGSDPIRSDTRAYALSSGMNPARTDPIPQLTHLLPKRARPYPTLYRSLHIIFRCGSDPIRSDTRACTPSAGLCPILSDPIPELIPLLPEWIRPDPIPYRSLHIFFRRGPDPIRPYPILSGPMPKLIHPLPEWIRSYPVRYQSLCPFFRNEPDPNRPHTAAYTSSSETGPTLSDPIPELTHYLPVRNRSYPIRCRSLYIFYRVVSDPIRSDTEAYTSHPGRIEPDQKPKAVCTVAMRFYRRTIRLLYNHK
jgi:hypothetical protein